LCATDLNFYAGFMVQESQFSFQFIFSFCSFY
jgi:hypothetical protein